MGSGQLSDKFSAHCWDVNSDLRTQTWDSGLTSFRGKKWKSHLLLVWSLTAFWKDQIMFTIEEDSCELDKERKEIKKTALYHPVHIWSVTLCHGMGLHTGVLKGCSNYLMQKTLPLSLASASETSRCKPESPQVARMSCRMATGRHYGNEGNLGQSPQITESRNKSQIKCYCFFATAEYSRAYGKLEFSIAKKEEGKIWSHQNKPDILIVDSGFLF